MKWRHDSFWGRGGAGEHGGRKLGAGAHVPPHVPPHVTAAELEKDGVLLGHQLVDFGGQDLAEMLQKAENRGERMGVEGTGCVSVRKGRGGRGGSFYGFCARMCGDGSVDFGFR